MEAKQVILWQFHREEHLVLLEVIIAMDQRLTK
jgi:hypothetical protein